MVAATSLFLLPLDGGAAEPIAAPVADASTSAPKRSHIQPVGEVAVASRTPDTLGLRLSRASDVLRQQLALSRGAGLVVDEVIPGSVADKAGFKQHDVLVLLDDQMLLLPEQLVALLEAADVRAVPLCTLLRGGAKVTLPLGQPGRVAPARQPAALTGLEKPAIVPAPKGGRMPPMPGVPQTAAKPATSPSQRLRTPASALAIVQPAASSKPPVLAPAATPATAAWGDETLLRDDPDYQLKLSRGQETRLVVLDPRGRIVFNDEIDTPERRSLIPPAVRDRVEEMERALENATSAPTAEIGRLETAPIEIR